MKPISTLLSLLGSGVGAMMIAAASPELTPMAADNLYGEWILTYTSAVTSRPYPGGHSLKITPIAGTDSVQLSKWYISGLPGPKGKVDLEKGTIFIPTQYLGKGKNGEETVDVWFAPRLSNGGPNWQAGGGITLTMRVDGNLSVDTQYGWGVYIYNTQNGYVWTSATGAGTIYKPNGSMKYVKNEAPADTIVTPVYMKQSGSALTVTNFFDVGRSVEFQIKADSTISVINQLAFQNATAPYYLANITKYDPSTGSISYTQQFTTLKGKTPNEIVLPPWSLCGTTSTGTTSWYGLYDWAEIKGDITFKYPQSVGLNGNGTSQSPYQIGSVEDWKKFADYTTFSSGKEEYFKLMADIDFTGKECPMACEQAFKGILLGNGKSIKGFVITTGEDTVGIMRRLDTGARIENLTLSGSIITSGRCAAILAGKANGTYLNSVTIGSPSEHSALTSLYPAKAVSDFTSTAGVVGYLDYGCIFDNVSNYADVTAQSGGVGGLAGQGRSGHSFTNCYNYGTIKISSTPTVKSQCIGGLIGALHPSRFIDCQNKGEVTGDTNTEYIAGLVGQAQSGTGDSGDFLFSNCQNRAPITGRGNVGGIIGTNSAGGTSTCKCYIQNCVNTKEGEIRSTATSNNASPLAGIASALAKGATVAGCRNEASVVGFNQYTGGIAGNTGTATQDMPIVVTECVNTGRVYTQTYNAGGIIGSVSAYNYVSKCFNTGDVDGLYGVGGIAGYIASVSGTKPSSLTDCVNAGKVTCITNRSGGIIGNCQSAQFTFSGCVNVGDVESLCENGGTTPVQSSKGDVSGYAIGGIAGISNGPVSNCVNFGSVKGVSRIGGIVGEPTMGNSKFTNCINLGALIAPNDTCGPIVGVNDNNSAAWSASNTVASCFYSDGVAMNVSNPRYANNLGEKLALKDIVGKNIEGMYIADAYCVPVPAEVKENPIAKLYSAQILPADNETIGCIKNDFHVGLPSQVEWSAAPASEITINGNLAKISAVPFVGIVALTARTGEYYRTVDVKVDNRDSGITNNPASAEIIEEAWYGADGRRCPRPSIGDCKIYMVVRRYADGSIKAIKVAN